MNIKCKLFGHQFPEVANSCESKPCDQWDNCDIKEHGFSLLTWVCGRCGVTKQEKLFLEV